MSHPDTNEKPSAYACDAWPGPREQHGWNGKRFYKNIEPTKDQDIINWLRSENAYLRGKIGAYERFLKDKGYIKEDK